MNTTSSGTHEYNKGTGSMAARQHARTNPLRVGRERVPALGALVEDRLALIRRPQLHGEVLHPRVAATRALFLGHGACLLLRDVCINIIVDDGPLAARGPDNQLLKYCAATGGRSEIKTAEWDSAGGVQAPLNDSCVPHIRHCTLVFARLGSSMIVPQLRQKITRRSSAVDMGGAVLCAPRRRGAAGVIRWGVHPWGFALVGRAYGEM